MAQRWWGWGLAVAVAASVSCGAGAQDGDSLAAEVERLEASAAQLAEAGLPEGLAGGVGRAREGLATVRSTRDPGLALYRLREPYVTLETLAFVAEHRKAWEDLAALEAAARSTPATDAGVTAAPAGTPTLHLALREAAGNKAERLHAAALPYGRAAGALSGVYYLGEANAYRSFGELAARIGARSPAPAAPEPAVDAAALESALAELESGTVTAFAKDPGSQTMIGVSARLKEARELLERGALAGAALTTLEARLGLTRRLEPQPAADAASRTPPAPAPAPAVAAPHAAGQGAAGSSLRALYVALAAEDSDPATARLVHRDVLPLHDRLLRSRP